ncbi:MAG: tRNA pseudouridine(55) synthase TruB [Spirochaetia bacterium]|nr:tRNA pseudouridine(55) synthase TruB [Spirochaetia bacterium]
MISGGILLLDKPSGITSFSSLAGVKKAFPGLRIGHTGTLDKFASGLMVVLAGDYSHLSPWFTGLDKVYEAEIEFGMETDTLDPEGTIIGKAPAPDLMSLEAALNQHIGPLKQRPPEYSAIHVNGKRSYQLARSGKEVELAPRDIEIYSISLREYQDNLAKVTVHCSSGTYIRALARDIAHACGSLAYVKNLRRTRVGIFELQNADPAEQQPASKLFFSLTPQIAESLGLLVGEIPFAFEKAFLNGHPGALDRLVFPQTAKGFDMNCSETDSAIFSEASVFLGIVSISRGKRMYRKVMPSAGAAAV